MHLVAPEAIVPERRPGRTLTGKKTLKKRTKTEINDLYLKALGSNVLATVKEAFAVAPGTEVIQLLVVRREIDKRHAGELAATYLGEFDRSSFAGSNAAGDPARSLSLARGVVLNLKGPAQTVSPIDVTGRPDLESVLEQGGRGLSGA